jgi:hypothetical protein
MSSELQIKPSWISAVSTNRRDIRIPPISGLSLLHILNEGVQGRYELETPVQCNEYFTLSAHYPNLAPFHLAQQHVDLCVRILHTVVPGIGQWMRDRSGQRCQGYDRAQNNWTAYEGFAFMEAI